MAVLTIAARYWQVLVGGLAAVGVLIYGRHQRAAGAAEREAKLRADAGARQLEAAEHANRAVDRLRNADPAERQRLRSKWTRGD